MEKKVHGAVNDEGSAAVALQSELTGLHSRLNFSDPGQREAHIQAFLAWLPKVLHDAPGIHWNRLPSRVMGYLMLSVADSPDAIPIALAIGCAMDGVKNRTLFVYSSQLTRLFRQLRAHYGMKELAELSTRSIWDQLVTGRTFTLAKVTILAAYEALASLHLRTYLEGLDVRQRVFWERYALPPLPTGFIDNYGLSKAAQTAAQQRRKEQSDVVLPLFPLLVEIAQLRKQAGERLIKEFRRHRDRAISGEIPLPYHFQYMDHLFSVTEDASSIAEVKLVEREVTLSFTLWDRMSWVKEHLEHYGKTARRDWERERGSYAPERNTYFLQYKGPSGHLLWIGDLIVNQKLGAKLSSSRSKRMRDFFATRPGMLTPAASDSHWLQSAQRMGDVLFEPESLYRAILFAAALATLALTNGSRLNELLQVSTTRFETVVVDELKNQQPTGRKIGILVQNLLPKGSRHESERQFFLISDMAARLLREIGELLAATHGGNIPIVHPDKNSKAEDLQPEPYLFQWAASSDGRVGLFDPDDVGQLLRFLFYGITLTTRTGTPIRVAPHLLRHVMATHVRTVKKIPAEAVAYLLHHRMTLSDSARALSIPEATAYYSRLPVEQLLALLFEAQSTLISHRGRSYLQAPSPRTLEQMDTALRQIFEQWGLIGPTALGYCSAGLCVRPDNRALCLNCQYLVPHYSNLSRAKIWRKLYFLQAQLHDDHGHRVDAQQARQMIQYIDDIIRVMELQIRTRQDGGYLPFADTLPPAQDEEGEAR
jgi:hypothetical protein